MDKVWAADAIALNFVKKLDSIDCYLCMCVCVCVCVCVCLRPST